MTYFACAQCGESGILPHVCEVKSKSPAAAHVIATGHSVVVDPKGFSACLMCDWRDEWMEQPDES